MTLHAIFPACQATVIFQTMSVRTLITPTLKSVIGEKIITKVLDTGMAEQSGQKKQKTYRQWPGVWWSSSCVIYEHRTCPEREGRPYFPPRSGWEGSRGMPTAPSIFCFAFCNQPNKTFLLLLLHGAAAVAAVTNRQLSINKHCDFSSSPAVCFDLCTALHTDSTSLKGPYRGV